MKMKSQIKILGSFSIIALVFSHFQLLLTPAQAERAQEDFSVLENSYDRRRNLDLPPVLPSEQRKHHVSTSVNFKVPRKWRSNSEQGYDHTDALFGVPFHKSRVILGSVFYMTPDYVSNDVVKSGCQDYSVALTDSELGLSKIYLVDRGSCTFTEKASIAQAKGAEAVIVANNECIKSDVTYLKEKLKLDDVAVRSICCAAAAAQDDVARDDCYANLNNPFDFLPFMTSNGQSASLNIFIPAVLISLMDAWKIKYCLCGIRPELKDGKSAFCKNMNDVFNLGSKDPEFKCDVDVIMEIKVDTPHPDNKVNYELWMKPDAQPTFLKEFEWFSDSIKKHSYFTPQYIVHEPIRCEGGTGGGDESGSMCDEYCIKVDDTESICYLPETDNLALNGVDILYEIVRQYCIWEQDNKTWGETALPHWWQYQNIYRDKECIQKTSSDEFKDCSRNIVSSFDSKSFDISKWETCSKKGGDEEKKVLRYLNDQQQQMGIFVTAMIVNTRVIHFSLTSDTIAARVCDGYADGSQPNVCKCVLNAQNENEFMSCQRCKDSKNCDVISGGGSTSSGGVSSFTVWLLLLFTITLVFGAFMYTRNTKMKMRSDMRNILSEYMPLDEVGGGAGGNQFELMKMSTLSPSNGRRHRGRSDDEENSNLI